MKATAPLLILTGLTVLFSSCFKDIVSPSTPHPTVHISIDSKCADGYYNWDHDYIAEFYYEDTMRMKVIGGVPGAIYEWHFGDGIVHTGPDTIVYHVFHSDVIEQPYIRTTDSLGTDSSVLAFRVGDIPLWFDLEGYQCWGSATFNFIAGGRDSTVLTISGSSHPVIQVPYIRTSTRTFIIPPQHRTDSISGLTYDFSGHGYVYTIRGFYNYLVMDDSLAHWGGAFGQTYYDYHCRDTIKTF